MVKDQMTGTVNDLVIPCRQCDRPIMRCECCEECPVKDAEIARLREALKEISNMVTAEYMVDVAIEALQENSDE